MKKIILILSFVLISSLTLFAQKKQRHEHHQKVTTEERINKRDETVTNKMVEVYGLSDQQKEQLLELNKSLYTKDKNVNQRFNRSPKHHKTYKQGKGQHKCDQCTHSEKTKKEVSQTESVQKFLANPILNQQRRQKQLNARIEKYTDGLKKIFTKKQYALYEKNVEEQLKNLD